MAGPQEDDMYLFNQNELDTPVAGTDFDQLWASSPADQDIQTPSAAYLNPIELSGKSEDRGTGPLRSAQSYESSSSSDPSDVADTSKPSTASPEAPCHKSGWSGGHTESTLADAGQAMRNTSMTGTDSDLDTSSQMFDFDTASTTPSGFDAASLSTVKAVPLNAFRRIPQNSGGSASKSSTPFYLAGSREVSPLNAMLPATSGSLSWIKQSPASGLEEPFLHMGMEGDSANQAAFSPRNMQLQPNNFNYDPESNNTPTTYQRDIGSTPSSTNLGEGLPRLTIYPTSLKSRVETQIPIKLVMDRLPPGAKKIRLPTYTVSKPKFLAKPEAARSPEILELHTSLVCTSAMQDPVRLRRALARARGEDLSGLAKPSPTSSTESNSSSKDDEDKPLNGGEVRICSGCIQRERKRASRKKQKKPDEEELFQKDEEKRVVVFNTNEIKEWVDFSPENVPPAAEGMSPAAAGAMNVDLPMRIACYCRHQNEKMGFQVIFTIKDHRDRVIAQSMTNSIMITDDHKTHSTPASATNPQMPQMPSAPQAPAAPATPEVYSPNDGTALSNGTIPGRFKQSFSTNDLAGMMHSYNPQYQMIGSNNPFATSGAMPMHSTATSGTMTPVTQSRPGSPTGYSRADNKRRKHSSSGKLLPTGLTMTPLDTSSSRRGGPATMPNTAATSPFAPSIPQFTSQDFSAHEPTAIRKQGYMTNPPTPGNANDPAFGASVQRAFSLNNLHQHTQMSAPPSRHASRPASPRPDSDRKSYGPQESSFNQAVNNSLLAHQPRRAAPSMHKLVPAEGNISGGTEVTVLGHGFYQGLEVMFGDSEATTTTFWGEKCLSCIAPPGVQTGVVPVVFKHEHQPYNTVSPHPHAKLFNYTDDREVELLRLALRAIGRTFPNPTDDPLSAAAQLLQQNQCQDIWSQHGTYSMG